MMQNSTTKYLIRLNRNAMLSTYFISVSLIILHVSTGVNCFNLEPSSVPCSGPQPNPKYIVYPGYNPTSGSIYSNDPSVLIFVNTFIDAVYNSEFLRYLFDLSETTVSQYIEFAYKYNLDNLSRYGFDNAEMLAEFGVRAIAPNFDVITMPYFVRFKANLASSFLHVEGVLTKENAENLALEYVKTIEYYGRTKLTEDPTSKFFVLTDSFIDFVSSVDPYAMSRMPLMVWMYGNEWFIGALNYKWFNQY